MKSFPFRRESQPRASVTVTNFATIAQGLKGASSKTRRLLRWVLFCIRVRPAGLVRYCDLEPVVELPRPQKSRRMSGVPNHPRFCRPLAERRSSLSSY